MTFQKQLFRQKIIDQTRQFFKKQNFSEVDTPILLPTLPLEQNLYSFKTVWEQKHKEYYLSISPESTLKKVLAAGLGNCFAISKCFRNLEDTGNTHNFEFTMLEWYELGKDYHDTASKTHKYINYVNQRIGNKHVQRVNYRLNELFQKFADIDLDKFLLSPDFSESDFHQIFLNKIEPQLPTDKLVFIFDYPSRLSPLAAPIAKTLYSQRFEVYLNGIEIGNGNTESPNATAIRLAFEKEAAYRLANNLPTHPIDYDFIKSCGLLPHCSGIGLGIDRLAMIFAKTNSIHDILWV